MPYFAGYTGEVARTRRVNSMFENQRTRRRVPIGLILAGGLMILTAAGVAGLALAEPAGSSVSLTPGLIVTLLFALVLAAAGIESIRRRHLLLAVVVPAVLALANLGYVIQTGQTAALVSVLIMVLVVVQVASQRSDFA
jgi:protein-S-isoprenylcysteine O-methyltransferase Ste14